MANIDEILEAREKTHGNFESHSIISQYIKDGMRETDGWKALNPAQAEALEMIAHKIARILNGNSCVHDHWDDIAGYATLASKSFEE